MEFPTAPSKVATPIDVSRVRDEKGVKRIIKKLLDAYGWYHWMPGANGYGAQGISDHLAIKDGVFLAVEAKFGYNKPRPTQSGFAGQIIANSGFAFCVNERNIDHLAWWLESFDIATKHQMAGLDVPDEHGARMLNAIGVLTDLRAEAI